MAEHDPSHTHSVPILSAIPADSLRDGPHSYPPPGGRSEEWDPLMGSETCKAYPSNSGDPCQQPSVPLRPGLNNSSFPALTQLTHSHSSTTSTRPWPILLPSSIGRGCWLPAQGRQKKKKKKVEKPQLPNRSKMKWQR